MQIIKHNIKHLGLKCFCCNLEYATMRVSLQDGIADLKLCVCQGCAGRDDGEIVGMLVNEKGGNNESN